MYGTVVSQAAACLLSGLGVALGHADRMPLSCSCCHGACPSTHGSRGLCQPTSPAAQLRPLCCELRSWQSTRAAL